VKLGIGELRGAIDGHKHVQLAVFRLHFGNVDMKVANRICGKLLFLCLIAFDLRQPADAMPLQAAMQG
jgi:hypothetical protein